MPYDISMERQATYLLVHIQGDPMTPEERRDAVSKVIGKAIELDVDVVVQEETRGMHPLTALEYFARANFLGTSGFRRRIAYVPPVKLASDKSELLTNAAWNQGRVVRVFSRVGDAIVWIESSEDVAG